MKKILKSLSVICLAILMLCPLALVGCDKNYKINIEVVSGEGFVYKKDTNSQPATGLNAVKKGEKFEFLVTPETGYVIDKVIIDGVEQTDYAKDGAYFSFEDIKKDHTVKVYFVTQKYTVTFYYLPEGGTYTVLKEVEVNALSSIDLNQAIYGGENNKIWYKKQEISGVDTKEYLYNGSDDITDAVPSYHESNSLFVRSNISLYCDLTLEQLEAQGVTR